MSIATHNVKKVAEYRQYIMSLLLNNTDLVYSIRDHADNLITTSQHHLIDQTTELSQLLDNMHAADLADLLEALPQDECLALWQLVGNIKRGQTLVEVAKPLWDILIKEMKDKDLIQAIKALDVDEQAYLAQYLPQNLMERLLISLEPALRAQVREISHYGKDTVGCIMNFELVTVRPDVTIGVVHRFLRMRKILPNTTDKIFITNRKNTLLGELPLTTVLLNDPETLVHTVMDNDPTCFQPTDKADKAASAFERYNLISAPVVNAKDELIGRLTIEDIIDVINNASDNNLRRLGGLSPAEDVFAPVNKVVKTRWTWLAVNLCTAFIASRVIGLFEQTISQLVELAALMPIVAGIGGNTGNQTITMVVRALALHQIEECNISRLLPRELGVAIINGVVWGGIMGVITSLLYGDLAIGGVMTLAIIINLIVAALMGVVIPVTMLKLGHDPAVGSSVIITALTDTGGFFIFLSLATLFLI
ncbi:magnesium transporter [Serratia symbiotica str. 'Cinara cedri']|nr:magnesium transporter [Serratia symbiotica str. 'Cinara cedri']